MRERVIKLFLIILAALLAASLLSIPVLVAEGEGKRWVRLMLPGSSFWLEFIHSVERTPVRDRFIISWGGELVLMEAVYGSYGAGLPPEGRLQAGRLVIENLETKLPELVLRVSPETQPILQIGGTRLDLTKLAPAGGKLWLRVLRPWQLMIRAFGLERARTVLYDLAVWHFKDSRKAAGALKPESRSEKTARSGSRTAP